MFCFGPQRVRTKDEFGRKQCGQTGEDLNYFNRDGGPAAANSITVPAAMYEDFKKYANS